MAVESWRVEALRTQTLNQLGIAYGRRDIAAVCMLMGWTVDQFKTELLRDLVPEGRSLTAVGLSQKEIQQYRVLTPLVQFSTRPDAKVDGLEAECSRAIGKNIGLEPRLGGFFVPDEIQRRTLTVAAASSGGYLVASQHSASSFIERLRNRSLVRRLGALILENLRGNVLISRATGEATGYWLSGETTQITTSQPAFGELPLVPKTVGAHTLLSRQLVLQSSPAAEDIVMMDLAAVLAVAEDKAAISGSGAAGEPVGILNATGIGSVSGTSLSYDACLEFQSDLLSTNALMNSATCGYLTTPAVAKLLGNRNRFSNTDSPIWQGNLADGMIAGFPAHSTKQMPTATMVFTDWSQLVFGEWGILEVATDPFTNFKTGKIGIRAFRTVDVGLRHVESVSVSTSIT